MSSKRNSGLYVHVPFCLTKCPYCDFYSVTSLSFIAAWLEALEKEASYYTGEYGVFDSLYFGGGTPSLLDHRQMARVMNCVLSRFHFAADTEVTIEINPDDATREKLALYREMGINRLSIGAQSLAEEDLSYLGRRHSVRQTLRVVDWARAEGFENLSLDFMYGLQRRVGFSQQSAWPETLERAVELRPEHLSCYQLTIEEDTPFGRMKSCGKIDGLTEDEESALFLFTSEFLEGRGYVHYEISNFARGVSCASRHNLKYWQHVPYLGLGPSAHSFKDGVRWWNGRSVEDYCRSLAGGSLPVAGRESLSPEQLRLEEIFLGSRTRSGFSMEAVRDLPGSGTMLASLEKSNIVRVIGGRVVPTRKGFLVADSIPLMFSD